MSALRARVATLDAEKASLSATMISNDQRDKQIIHEQAVKLKELEMAKQTLDDNVGHMRIAEQALTRKLVKIEATYEEMLRDFEDFKHNDMTSKKRAKAYENLENFAKQKLEHMEKSLNQMEQDKIRLLRDIKAMSLEREKLCNTKAALEDKLKHYESESNCGMRGAGRGNKDVLDRITALNARKELLEQRTQELEVRNGQFLEQIRNLESEKETLSAKMEHLRNESKEARNAEASANQSASMLRDQVDRLLVKSDAEADDPEKRQLRQQLSEAERQEGNATRLSAFCSVL